MLILIIIIVLFIITYVLVAPKNIIIWYVSIYALNLSVVIFAGLLFVFKFSNYPILYNLDYKLYLYLKNFRFSLSEVRIIFSIGIIMILMSNVFFIYIINMNKNKKEILFFLLPIVLYGILNSPKLNSIFYITEHVTKSFYTIRFMNMLPRITSIYNRMIIVIYHVLPIVYAIKSYKKTRIRLKKQSIIITLVCIILLYFNVLYLTFGKLGMYFDLDFHNFPVSGIHPTVQMVVPLSFLFVITLIFGLLVFFQPFRNFTILSGKANRTNSWVSINNLRMFFHMQKNFFVAISKFSQLSLEDCKNNPEHAYYNFKTIKNLSDNTIDNLSHNLDMLHSPKISPEKVSVYEIIESSLHRITLSSDIKIDKVYPQEALYCMVDKQVMTECFVNILSNAVDAIEISGNDNGRIIIVIDYDYDMICIDIIDDGCGIEKSNLKHVFKPLFSSKSGQKNYGLGLSYVKNNIMRHNGYINIKSVLGQGTTVQVVLPKPNEKRFKLWRK